MKEMKGSICILLSCNTICKNLGSHNALKYRQLSDLFSQRAWRWPNKGWNMSPWQYTIFIVYKIKCCVIDWHIVFICHNTSGWKTFKKIYNIDQRNAQFLNQYFNFWCLLYVLNPRVHLWKMVWYGTFYMHQHNQSSR